MNPILTWKMPPILYPEPIFDFSICFDQRDLDFIHKASQETLRSSQIEQVKKIVGLDPTIISHLLNTEFVNQILDFNPNLILIFAQMAPFTMDIIMQVVYAQCLEIQVMEIVRDLARDKCLSSDTLYIYIQKLASACEALNEQDIQDRKVRMASF